MTVTIKESFYNNTPSYSYQVGDFHSPLHGTHAGAVLDAKQRFGDVHIETLEEARERLREANDKILRRELVQRRS
jgi:hypothetical protein